MLANPVAEKKKKYAWAISMQEYRATVMTLMIKVNCEYCRLRRTETISLSRLGRVEKGEPIVHCGQQQLLLCLRRWNGLQQLPLLDQ